MKTKGHKISDSKRTRTIGIACNSLFQLIEKGKQKLNIAEKITVALEDGTLIEDEEYFQTIPAQTLFIFYLANEDVNTGTDVLLNALKCVNSTYLRIGSQAAQLLEGKAKELVDLISETQGTATSVTKNTPQEDPSWFERLETNAKCKEDYMRRKAQDRVRGYLYKFQDDVKKSQLYISNKNVRETLTECLAYLKKKLATDSYFGCYFDRRCADMDELDSTSEPKKKKINNDYKPLCFDYNKYSYCDSSGKFKCEGIWNDNYCSYGGSHSINPYLTREARILFSTWNLDHRIEKSRTVLPALLSAVEKQSKDIQINYEYIYVLLFTRCNLKLVHIVCHDKGSHSLTCEDHLLFLASS